MLAPNKKIIHQGYSLIELMVTMFIGLIILNGVFHVVLSSKRSKMDLDEISYIQDNARFAFDILGRDIRMAGYIGCANNVSEQVNIINGDAMGFLGMAGISGFDGDENTPSFPSSYRKLVKAKTDSLLIRRGESDQELLVRSHNPTTKTINLWQDHTFKADEPLAIVDATCNFSALFTASAITSANSLSHKISRNNCNDVLKGQYTCNDCSSGYCPRALTAGGYSAGARIMPLISNAYFIGDSTLIPGLPALKRQSMVTLNGQITTQTEELAIGIENIQFLYGVDTEGKGTVNEYRKANQMDVNNDGYINSIDWLQVLTVKIDLLLVSQRPVFTEPQTVVFDGVNYLGLFMRQVVSTTVQIRNKNT